LRTDRRLRRRGLARGVGETPGIRAAPRCGGRRRKALVSRVFEPGHWCPRFPGRIL